MTKKTNKAKLKRKQNEIENERDDKERQNSEIQESLK